MVPFSWLFYSQISHLLTLLGLFIDQNDRFPYPFIYFETLWKHYPFIYLKPEKRINSYWVEPPCTGHYLGYPPLPPGFVALGRAYPYNNLLLCPVPHRHFINFCHENDMPAKLCLYLSYTLALWGCIMFNLNFSWFFFLLSFFLPLFLLSLFL